jgi:hypothetical protein
VRTKAVLVAADASTVVWCNDAATQGLEDRQGASEGVLLEEIVPMAEELGLPGLLREVSATGESQNLKFDLVSTTRGSVTTVMSIDRLPDGTLLLLVENSWQAKPKAERPSGTRNRR